MDLANQTAIKIGTLVSLLVVAIISAFVPPLLSLAFYLVSFTLRIFSASGKGNKFIDKLTIGTEKLLVILLTIMETFQVLQKSISKGFAGGVLLSAGLIHLLPDAIEEFEDYMKTVTIDNPTWAWVSGYPWPFLFCCFGVVILLFMENVILAAIPSEHGHAHSDSHKHDDEECEHDHHHGHDEECEHDHHHHHDEECEHDHHQNEEESKNITADDSQQQTYQTSEPAGEESQKLLKKREVNDQITEMKSIKHKSIKKHSEKQLLKCLAMFFGPSNIEKTLLGLLFHLSLSVHCFLEGLGLGISTDPETVISIFVAIISHKFVEGFALGVYLNNVNYEELYPNYFKNSKIFAIAEEEREASESDDEESKEKVKDAVINFSGYGKSAETPKWKRLLFALFSQKLSFIKQISTFGWISFLLVTFCCSTPLGILIGTLVAKQDGEGEDGNPYISLAKGVVLALAAGTFLFIVLCEIMNPHGHSHGGGGEHEEHKEHKKHKNHKKMIGGLFLKCGLNVLLKSFKFGLFVVGFTAMSVIAIWA